MGGRRSIERRLKSVLFVTRAQRLHAAVVRPAHFLIPAAGAFVLHRDAATCNSSRPNWRRGSPPLRSSADGLRPRPFAMSLPASAFPGAFDPRTIHPATLTYQAHSGSGPD